MSRTILFTYPHFDLSGALRVHLLLAEELARRGVEVRLIPTGHGARGRFALPDLPTLRQIRLQLAWPLPGWIPGQRRFIQAWYRRWGRRFSTYVSRLGPAVFIPGYAFPDSTLIGRLPGTIRTVAIAHSLDESNLAPLRAYCPHPTAYLGVSPLVAERVRATLPASEAAKVHCIPNGVPCPREFPRGDRPRPPGPLRLLYAGRLEQPDKRVLDLAEIAEGLAARNLPFELAVAGDGSQRAHLQTRFAVLRQPGTARLLGTLPPDRLLAEYRRADCLLLTSAWEGTPLALLEAMAQGCVPFATRTESGAPDIVQNGASGHLVEIGDTSAFVRLLADYAHSPKTLEPLRRGAWSRVAHGPWRLDHMVDSYQRLFADLLGS